MEQELNGLMPKITFFKRFRTRKVYIPMAIIALFITVFGGIIAISHYQEAKLIRDNAQNQNTEKDTDKKKEEPDNGPYSHISGIPNCPSDLTGILTSSFIETEFITFIDPLGAVNPPGGHAEPVDHNYFQWETNEKIRLFAPADAWITEIMAGYSQNATGQYDLGGYTLTFAICKGASVVLTTYIDINQSIKDELKTYEPDCSYDIRKSGHEERAEGQCTYSNLAIKVRSGEELGWTQKQRRADGTDVCPFEIWAYNYTQEPRTDIQWDKYYQGYRYATCLFDWYRDPIKKEYYSKLGWNGVFRTVEPRCGEIEQTITGTLQGAWFKGEGKDSPDMTSTIVVFFHDHLDPTKGKITTNGFLTTAQADEVLFSPQNTGTIDREPSEVTADGQIYCYAAKGQWNLNGKLLTQVIDDSYLKLEYREGNCSSEEVFGNPAVYER